MKAAAAALWLCLAPACAWAGAAATPAPAAAPSPVSVSAASAPATSPTAASSPAAAVPAAVTATAVPEGPASASPTASAAGATLTAAASSAAAESPTAAAAPARHSWLGSQASTVRVPRSQWKDWGFEYRAALGVLKLANGQALSYIPLEASYRFRDGWILRADLESFDYTGLDTDATTQGAGEGPQRFYYQMDDVGLAALHVFLRRHALRPFAGVTVESVFGSRWLAVNPDPQPGTAQATESAHGFEALGAEGGLEYRGGPSWFVSWEARYALGVGYWSTLAGTDFGWHYLF